MKKLLLTKEQRNTLCDKFNITPSTLSEVANFKRLDCKRHAMIREYAVNKLSARVILK
jgi:hypothetical protein